MSGNEELISALYKLYEEASNNDFVNELSRYIKELRCARRDCANPTEKSDIERDIASLQRMLRSAKELQLTLGLWDCDSPYCDIYNRLPRSVLYSLKCVKIMIDDAEQGRAFDIDDIVELAGQRWDISLV